MREATQTSVEHPEMRLRLLQTTDLHMQLIPYDYDNLVPAPDRSLLHLQQAITDLRAQGIPTLLFDTGDFLQGNPTADLAIEAAGTHPMISAFNALRYDAIVLGNHDFDYGLASLQKALAHLACPVLAANVGLAGENPVAQDYVILPVHLPTDGGDRTVKVGLLGLTTPHVGFVASADQAHLLSTCCPLRVARKLLPQMKAQGADIIVALCHFGIDPDDETENIASLIAALPEVDAVLAGHTHDVFPGPDIAKSKGIDPDTGTLSGKPAVMSGAYGKHIGVIDLTLTQTDGLWTVANGVSRIVTPASNLVPPPLSAPGLLALHDDTLARLRAPVAKTDIPMSTAFSLIQPDMTQQLLATSRIARITQEITPRDLQGRPVLGSAAPYRVGGKHAQDSYVRVAPGPVTLHNVLGIYPYRDPVVGLAQTGAQIKAWLERSAGLFFTIMPGQVDQALINPAFPPHFFTTIYGLTYTFDLSQKVGNRLRDLRHAGEPVKDKDSFIVATTPHLRRSNRAAYDADLLTVTAESSQDILIAYLQKIGTVAQARDTVWDFAPLPETAATFTTYDPGQIIDIDRTIRRDGHAAQGLQRFSLHFD